LLTAAEVAALLRVSKMTVYRLVDTGQLTSMRIGRSHRITRAALRTYLAGTYAPAAYETAREA
jgi:excisionase family DNA binding protein